MAITLKNHDTGSLQLSTKDVEEMGVEVGTTLAINGKAFKVSFLGVAGRRGIQQVCFRGCGPVPTGDLTVEVGTPVTPVVATPKFSKEQLLEMLAAADQQ